MKQQPKPPSPEPVFSDWSFVELLGKRRRAGVAEAVNWHGIAMLRVRVPSARENFHFATEEFYNLEKAVFALRVATQEQVMDVLFPLPKPEPRTCPECRNAQPRFDHDGYLWCDECGYDPEDRHSDRIERARMRLNDEELSVRPVGGPVIVSVPAFVYDAEGSRGRS